MRKKITLILSGLLMAGMAYDYNNNAAHTFTNGAPSGNTGSPGDGQTCNTSCHTQGGTQTNEMVSVTSDVPGTGYVAGQTYTFTITTSGGGSKKGFQVSPQDVSGNLIGTLIASGTGTQFSAGGSTHITHNAAGTSSSSWTFEWTAPTSGTGDVTFYVAVNFTNTSGDQFGDVVVTETLTVQESSVGISEAELAALSVYPNPVIDEINIAAKDVDEEIMVTMFNMEGKLVIEQSFEPGDITIDVASKSLNTGVYFLQMEAGGNTTVKKLLVK